MDLGRLGLLLGMTLATLAAAFATATTPVAVAGGGAGVHVAYTYELTPTITTDRTGSSFTAFRLYDQAAEWSVLVDITEPSSVAAEEPSGTPPDLENLIPKIEKQMAQRGWTPEQIQEAYDNGEQVPATNKANGASATRYVNPDTGQSMVVDNSTGQVIHVGGPGFKYGPESGDLP